MKTGLDEKKICFIACVNDDFLYEESLVYINELLVPAGMSVELIAVRGAASMTAGYQEAMLTSDAKYKIYIHQDVFLLEKNSLKIIINIFQANKNVGMIGLAGTAVLPKDSPVWWKGNPAYGNLFSKKDPETIQHDCFGICNDSFVEAAAVDGFFLATQYDCDWRQDLFKSWHFYDISQAREFINTGYKVVIPRQDEPWLIHACGRRATDEVYLKNMEIFKANYVW